MSRTRVRVKPTLPAPRIAIRMGMSRSLQGSYADFRNPSTTFGHHNADRPFDQGPHLVGKLQHRLAVHIALQVHRISGSLDFKRKLERLVEFPLHWRPCQFTDPISSLNQDY